MLVSREAGLFVPGLLGLLVTLLLFSYLTTAQVSYLLLLTINTCGPGPF